ncbi:uncharacterized protein LOC123679727 [Harmonia axyridis]|uniref:uncharacterized protein LOC123679727 n=1 Tax=Harmonia axyridis TaxID=115357 RepID=UPI001E2762BA|nr:uncharacterized protein LOC123679727 [Harmonia axyridis]
MKCAAILGLFVCLVLVEDAFADSLGTYFYKELGCTEKTDSKVVQYTCPDFLPKNGTCNFKRSVLNIGEEVDKEDLKGSCHATCVCSGDGHITCAHYDCFERLKSGCSHFKYSLDRCCAVDSVCGPIATCEIEGKTYQEGNTVHLKEKCEVCVCDVNFQQKAPFCRPRKCYDRATFANAIERFGAPAFFKNENCCPNVWVTDEGQELVKMNQETASESGVSCNFGTRKVALGYGFKTKVKPYGTEVSLNCECSMPPYLICKEAA